MELKKIPYDFTVCKLKQDSDIDVTTVPFYVRIFASRASCRVCEKLIFFS